MRIAFGDIELVNFRSFSGSHRFSFDRPPGVYFVSGRNEANPALGANGVGKSTLLVDAPLWCLTGTVTRSSRPAAGVVTWGNDKVFMRVALHLAIDGIEHVVERTRNPNALLLDGKDVEQRDVDQLLCMTEAQLRRTIVVPQFGDLFLDLRPEAQSQMFTDMLRLDVWLRAARLAADEVAALGVKLRKVETEIAAQERVIAELTDQLAVGKTKRDEFEDALAREIRETEGKLAKVRKELAHDH